MPEALVVLAVFFVSAAVYFYAWLETRNPARHNPAQDLTRLRQHTAWLQDRLRLAERESWDEDMIANLAADLATTSRQLAQASGSKSSAG